MAFLASIAGRQMRAMAEHHERRNLIHPNPLRLPPILRECSELLNLRTVCLHRRMASHARGYLGNAHQLAWVGIRVTVLAGNLQRACMNLMAVVDRLLGSRLWCLRHQRHHTKQNTEKLHQTRSLSSGPDRTDTPMLAWTAPESSLLDSAIHRSRSCCRPPRTGS